MGCIAMIKRDKFYVNYDKFPAVDVYMRRKFWFDKKIKRYYSGHQAIRLASNLNIIESSRT